MSQPIGNLLLLFVPWPLGVACHPGHPSTHNPPHKQWLMRLKWVVLLFIGCWGSVCCAILLWCHWCHCWHPPHWSVVVVIPPHHHPFYCGMALVHLPSTQQAVAHQHVL
jgi:hypothetical protein